MAIRTILAAASGGSASGGAIELGCRLAQRLKAHVEGFHALVDPASVLAAAGAGDGVPAMGPFIDSVMKDAAATAAATRAVFDEAAARHRLTHRSQPQMGVSDGEGSACWREETGYAPGLVAQRARFFDLVVLGRSERVVREPSSNTIEETLARSGRPILLAPARPPANIGYVMAVAWNGSPQAVRALSVALPLLTAADAVSLITVGDGNLDEVPSVVEYLTWHGVAAKHVHAAATRDKTVGATLLDTAGGVHADILVMGGYGHRPWREALFGGVTREVLATGLMPLLLVH
ncbi:MAG TPA: universal stress protein [Stellaceae bacterium]|nr:universal stress protein [Stellaceae bacterium]